MLQIILICNAKKVERMSGVILFEGKLSGFTLIKNAFKSTFVSHSSNVNFSF